MEERKLDCFVANAPRNDAVGVLIQIQTSARSEPELASRKYQSHVAISSMGFAYTFAGMGFGGWPIAQPIPRTAEDPAVGHGDEHLRIAG
jgi:hypothetical protein